MSLDPFDYGTDYGYGKRVDKTNKGLGYFGELKRPDNKISTELSIGVNLGGKEMEIPTIVPTLTKEEIDYLLQGNKPTSDIIQKAIGHAKKRISEGKNPFAQQGEQQQLPIENSEGLIEQEIKRQLGIGDNNVR